MSVQKRPFSMLLNDSMTAVGILNHRRLEEYLLEQGITGVTYKRVSDYLNDERVPSPELGQKILFALGEEYTLEEMREIVEYSKTVSKEKREELSIIRSQKERKVVNIDYGRLVKGLTHYEAKAVLLARIEEICGKENDFSTYVMNLIKKDLQEVILSEEDVIDG